MADKTGNRGAFFRELRRRHVVRVGLAYLVVSWLLLQLGAIIFPTLHAPSWCEAVLLAFLVLGFPVALLLAWAFEVTPEGVRRTEPTEGEAARTPRQRRRVGRRIDFVIIVVLAAAVGILLWRQFGASSKPQSAHIATAATAGTAATVRAPASATVIPAKSIAVLPFENLSTDKANAYFADGMQDLILTKLAGIGDLKVISRTSTLQYGSHPQNLKQIGRELGVATLLEGSVQKAGDQVLIDVQLIDARTDSHIWAQSYTRTLNNVFGVEGEVAEKVAQELQAKLSPADTKRLATTLSSNPAANDLFLRAEYLSNHGFLADDSGILRRATPLYRKAIAMAPDFALARARLSYVESYLAWIGASGEDVAQLNADAHAQAEQALKLAPNLAAAHVAIGYCDYYGKGDYDGALKAFAAALQARPNDAGALAGKAYVLRRQARIDAAIDAFRQALTYDPRNSFLFFSLGETYMMAGRYPEAEQAMQSALALDPDNQPAKLFYSRSILYDTGDVARALAAVQGDSSLMRFQRALLLVFQRRYQDALELLDGIPPDTPVFDNYTGSRALNEAELYRLSGDAARARALYAKALPEERARLAAQAAGSDVKLAFVWNHIAKAELGLGRTGTGMQAIARSQALAARSGDLFFGPFLMQLDAALYAEAGRADLAVPLLARALAAPGIGAYYSPVMLWLDPAWDPIRKDPGFQALLKKYAKDKPATVPTVGSVPTASTAPAS